MEAALIAFLSFYLAIGLIVALINMPKIAANAPAVKSLFFGLQVIGWLPMVIYNFLFGR